jgi:Holliday junction resolvase
MSQRESKLSRDLMNALRAEGAFCNKNHGSEYSMAGLPDISVCYLGLYLGFETKLPEKRSNTSVVQERVMQKIRDAGGHAQVVCTPKEAVEAMMNHARDSRRRGMNRE